MRFIPPGFILRLVPVCSLLYLTMLAGKDIDL